MIGLATTAVRELEAIVDELRAELAQARATYVAPHRGARRGTRSRHTERRAGQLTGLHPRRSSLTPRRSVNAAT
jgi:hypothetical protein